jgi:uncharacterized protein YukE
MDRIRLVPEQLDRLGGEIEAVHDDLASSAATFGDQLGGLESVTIESALAEFDADWSDRRAKLVELLARCATSVRDAARSFCELDDQLAAEAKAGASASGGAGASGGGSGAQGGGK